MAGLLAGLLLPGFAQALRPWLPELIGSLIFLSAFRIGPRAALGGMDEAPRTLALVVIYQMALPLVALGIFALAGVGGTVPVLALVLMMSAPSVTGSPNFTILMRRDPAPALRLLILGTVLFPITSVPVLALMPGLDEVSVVAASVRLLGTIGLATGAGFLLRWTMVPTLHDSVRDVADGVSALLLAVVVIGLMSAIGPALAYDPAEVGLWLAVAMAANLGLQGLAFVVLRHRPGATARAIVAGNRNIALYLIALPPEATAPLLIFIGCYQVPMYLTPILMAPLYRRAVSD